MTTLMEKARDAQIATGLELLSGGENAPAADAPRPPRLATAALVLLGVGVAVFALTRGGTRDVAPPRPVAPVQDPAPAKPVAIRSVDQIANLDTKTRAVRCIELGRGVEQVLTHCSALERLEVVVTGSGNPVEPATPDLLAAIARHKTLRAVVIEGMHDPRPATLASLPALQHLGLIACDITVEQLARLTELPGLLSLDLGSAFGIDDEAMAALARLRGLQSLRLAGTDEATSAGLARLAVLTELRSLDLAAVDVQTVRVFGQSRVPQPGADPLDDAALSALATLKKLGTLHLDRRTGYTAKGLAPLLKVAPLTELHLGNATLGAEIWGQLPPTLRHLDLSACTAMCAAIPESMPGLTRLEILFAGDLDDDAVGRIATWPALRHLHLILAAKVTKRSLPHLAGMKKLHTLVLAHIEWLDDEALRAFAHLTGLVTLDVSGARAYRVADNGGFAPVGGERTFGAGAIAALAALRRLEVLKIRHNQPTPVAALRALADCPLRELDVTGTEIGYDEDTRDRAALLQLWPGIDFLPKPWPR